MAVTVETLEKLERKISLSLPVTVIQSEVDARLKKMARTVKMDGFRPGKVPMNVVAQRYGYSVQYEVMNDKVGEAFAVAANEAKLRVAGQPRITEKDGVLTGTIEKVFEAGKQDAKCDKCSDDRKDKPVLGLEIIRGAKKADGKDVWEGGKILDPENGRNYTLRLTPIEGGKKLEVRGSIGPFGRTQTWIRIQ